MISFPCPKCGTTLKAPEEKIGARSKCLYCGCPVQVPAPPPSDGAKVAAHAEAVLPLATASLGEEYYYQSLPLCVIDAVWSIGVRYEGVQNVVARYCKYTGQRRVRSATPLPPTADQERISKFCDRLEQADPEQMAKRVYCNRQRTSARSGILKADAVAQFARCLRSYQVEFFQDVPCVANSPHFEADIRRITGQDSGISLGYFLMLAGDEDFVKADRHVIDFLETALSRCVAVAEALPLVSEACRLLTPRYPHLTPRLVDHEIWKYQRNMNRCRRSRQPGNGKGMLTIVADDEEHLKDFAEYME